LAVVADNPAPVAAEAPAVAAPPARPEAVRPRFDRDEPAEVGLGDHVPAFLLRPVRLAAKGG
jgi:hypothetical protein